MSNGKSMVIKTVFTISYIVQYNMDIKMVILSISVVNMVMYKFLQYTGCNRRNGPDFGREFLRSNYTDITQNTYIQS